MRSAAWAATRRVWLATEQERTGHPVVCAVCGANTELELHHLDYDRLGREHHEDLVPLCAGHHEHLHNVLDASREWRRLPRRAASAGIIASMRRH